MKNENQKIRYSRVSVIGLKGFPADFVGTTGIESYVEQIMKHTSRVQYLCYVRDSQSHHHTNVTTKAIPTIRQRHLSSIVYGFQASILASQDTSEIVWYHAIGSSIFYWIPKLFGKKVIVTFHGLDWQRRKWNFFEKKILFFFTKMILKLSDQITTVSEREKAELEKLTSKKIHLLQPGFFDYSTKQLTNNKLQQLQLEKARYFLFLGRLVPEKRVEWLINAVNDLSFPDMKLVIAGDEAFTSSYKKSLLLLSKKNPSIHFVGYIFGDEKLSLIKNARALIQPSEHEGNSISVIEALSLNTPVLIAEELVEKNVLNHSLINTYQMSSFLDFKTKLRYLGMKKKKTQRNLPTLISWQVVGDNFRKIISTISF